MTSLKTLSFLAIATLLLQVALTTANVGLKIALRGREDNYVRIQCREHLLDGITIIVQTDPNLFLFNSSMLLVTTFLEAKGIETAFDPQTGILGFEVRQDVEGYYFCSNDGEMFSESDPLIILAHPHRHYDGPSRHVKRVGEPVRICNGVGEGSLGNHYRVQWYKNSIDLNEGSITRGEDFSLLLESVKRSDSGVYHSDVTVYDANNQNIEYVVTPDILIELIVYQSPSIEPSPTSMVVDQKKGRSKTISFHCIATGEPLLKVSWFKNGQKNLTAVTMDSSRYIIEQNKTNDGARIESKLTIRNGTHRDSGVYVCVATILHDQTGEKEFWTQENATLTVLDSHFNLKTVVTEKEQLQLWVELEVPLPDAVKAVVYFTLVDDPNTRQRRITSSALINSTIMLYQLESHDIPDAFQHKDFRVQVALQVGLINGPLVPSNLEDADIRNIYRPSSVESGCDTEHTKKLIAAFVCASVVLLVGLLVLLVVIVVCHPVCVRRERRKKIVSMPNGVITEEIKRRNSLEDRNRDLCLTHDPMSEQQMIDYQDNKEKIKRCNATIRGDGGAGDLQSEEK